MVSHSLHCFLNRCFISEVIMADGMKLFIQFVHKWNSCRDVYSCDIGIRHVVQILYQCTKAIPMSYNQDSLTALQLQSNTIMPAWEESRYSIHKAFRGGELFRKKKFIARIVGRMSWIFYFESRGTDVVTPPPFVYLFFSVFCLLYTSDAADEEDSVDLGGRRI